MATVWYYKTSNSIHGPFTSQQLREHARRGRIRADSPIRKGKSGEWIEAIQMKGLLDFKRVGSDGNTKPQNLSDATWLPASTRSATATGYTKPMNLSDGTADNVVQGDIASGLECVPVQPTSLNGPQLCGTEIAGPAANGENSPAPERTRASEKPSYSSLDLYASFCDVIGVLGLILLAGLIFIGSLVVSSNETYSSEKEVALKAYWATAWPHFITLGFASFMSLATGAAIRAFIDLVVNTIQQRALSEEMIHLLKKHYAVGSNDAPVSCLSQEQIEPIKVLPTEKQTS